LKEDIYRIQHFVKKKKKKPEIKRRLGRPRHNREDNTFNVHDTHRIPHYIASNDSKTKKKNLRGRSLQAKYTKRVTAACRRS
jgi:hypothetical protein